MGGLNLAVDAGIGRDHQRPGLLGDRADIAADDAVHPQAAGENHVALDASRRADQAVDPVLRLVRLVEHASLPYRLKKPISKAPLLAWRAAGSSQSRKHGPGRFPPSLSG